MKYFVFIIVIVFSNTFLFAQKVGMGTASPSSFLDINGGPRLSSKNTTIVGTSVMLNSNSGHHILFGSPTNDFTITFMGATKDVPHLILTNTTISKEWPAS